jgi:hypothetical protein
MHNIHIARHPAFAAPPANHATQFRAFLRCHAARSRTPPRYQRSRSSPSCEEGAEDGCHRPATRGARSHRRGGRSFARGSPARSRLRIPRTSIHAAAAIAERSVGERCRSRHSTHVSVRISYEISCQIRRGKRGISIKSNIVPFPFLIPFLRTLFPITCHWLRRSTRHSENTCLLATPVSTVARR